MARFHRIQRDTHGGEVVVGAPFRGEMRHLGFEAHAHFQQLQHVLDRGDLVGRDLEGAVEGIVGDIGARPAPRHEQTARRQTRKGFAHHRPADAEFLGDDLFGGVARSGFQLARFDQLLEFLHQIVGERGGFGNRHGGGVVSRGAVRATRVRADGNGRAGCRHRS